MQYYVQTTITTGTIDDNGDKNVTETVMDDLTINEVEKVNALANANKESFSTNFESSQAN
jgi:hypothetical protein